MDDICFNIICTYYVVRAGLLCCCQKCRWICELCKNTTTTTATQESWLMNVKDLATGISVYGILYKMNIYVIDWYILCTLPGFLSLRSKKALNKCFTTIRIYVPFIKHIPNKWVSNKSKFLAYFSLMMFNRPFMPAAAVLWSLFRVTGFATSFRKKAWERRRRRRRFFLLFSSSGYC